MGRVTNTELTTNEHKALCFYKEFLSQYKKAPTFRQIAEHLGVYPNAARWVIDKLKEKGHLVERPVTVMRLKVSAKGKKAI
jgi:predicted ArsR family transcriptional regulator